MVEFVIDIPFLEKITFFLQNGRCDLPRFIVTFAQFMIYQLKDVVR